MACSPALMALNMLRYTNGVVLVNTHHTVQAPHGDYTLVSFLYVFAESPPSPKSSSSSSSPIPPTSPSSSSTSKKCRCVNSS
mmetsp:Transcript_27282/g.68463  ORF Transcript_27282/g.68463 Transcript_27282/m.68463 type:complete len:82 (+) Transcript_27282:1-246(+)